MRKLPALLLPMLIITACSGPPERKPTLTLTPPQATSPTETPSPLSPTSKPESPPKATKFVVEEGERYNFLILGGDFRAHRAGTGRGNKTDVMLLLSIKDNEPVWDISIIQFPRNFYTPIQSFPDMWLFSVYGEEGAPGIHYYFQEAFNIALDGIFYVNMDDFVVVMDGLFPTGFVIPATDRDYGFIACNGESVGECALSWLRDNENNWGCPEYDCGDRQIRFLVNLGEAVKRQWKDQPLGFFEQLWDVGISTFIETDLSTWEQISFFIRIGVNLMFTDYQLHTYKLTESGTVIYGDTPLDVRGWVEAGGTRTWLWEILH
jgi:hypothetical protein